jgi:hypothetical protein
MTSAWMRIARFLATIRRFKVLDMPPALKGAGNTLDHWGTVRRQKSIAGSTRGVSAGFYGRTYEGSGGSRYVVEFD